MEPALPAEIDRLPDGFNAIITSQMHCAKRISWLRNATACYRGSTCMRQRDGFDRRVQGGRWLCAAASASIRFWPLLAFSLTLMDPTFTPPNCLAPDVARIFCRFAEKVAKEGTDRCEFKVSQRSTGHQDEYSCSIYTDCTVFKFDVHECSKFVRLGVIILQITHYLLYHL